MALSDRFKWLRLFKRNKRYKESIIVNQTNVRPIQRDRKDITKWRNAIISAEGTMQQRQRLYELYDDMLHDGHLRSTVDKRVRAITNRALTFQIDGKEVEEVVDLSEKSFFEDLIKELVLAKMWGHSLVELHWPGPKTDPEKFQGWSKLIDRRHVKPRLGIVTKDTHDMEGIPYREDPYKKVVIEAGDDEDLGLLLQCCQYVIYKRGGFGDWAEFAEVFGMPFRWATYNNEQSREILTTALEEAGSAGYVVAPEDANLQYIYPSNTTGTDIFDRLRRACNEEISVTLLGNTMTTTEAHSGGYAQSETQSEGQEEIHKDDRMFVIRILNEKLTPFLERLGYQVKGGKWSFVEEETMSLKERLEIDLKVSEKVPLPASYWYEKYRLPMPTADDLPAEESRAQKEEDDQPGESKKKARQ